MISLDHDFQGSRSHLLPFLTFICFSLCISLMIFSGCTQKKPIETLEAPQEAQALIKRGKAIYQAQCTACHNTDPRKSGALGPDVYGSSKELLTARIMHADYPPDYKAKRYTHQMQAMPHLKNEIDAIHAYLNSDHAK